MATNPLPNEPLESLQVYSATYSNVPVYEFITPNGSVMRRKSDGWVNATHILKVANFPKAKRTRILEKDVQTGVHEKVQGGYGKYQGTWVPLDRAVLIANEYSVDRILAPIFDFTRDEGSASPPPAPKHHNASSKAAKMASLNLNQHAARSGPAAASSKPATAKKLSSLPLNKVAKSDEPATRQSSTTSKKRGRPPKSAQAQLSVQDHVDYSPPPQLPPIVNKLESDNRRVPNNFFYVSESQYSPERIDDHRIIHHPSSSPSDFMSDTDLAAALRSPEQSFQPGKAVTGLHRYSNGDAQQQIQAQQAQIHNQHLSQAQHLNRNHNHNQGQMNSFDGVKDEDQDMDEEEHPSWYYSYRSSLLEYFHTPDDGLTDTPLPEFLSHPPPGFDINHGVDNENNTALHWACAVGDLRITDTLLQCGANANIMNNDGYIPIMRSVLFTNPYERRTFAKLLDLLRESLLSVSHDAKTILHLIALSTNSKIRLNAARYYMEMLLGKISAYHPRETVVNYVNKQDDDGNTALHLVSKNTVKKYLNILIAYGARIDIPNKQGERVEDLLHYEAVPSGSTSSTFQETQHFALSQPQQNSGINPYYQNFNNNQHLTSASLTTSVPRILPVPHFSEAAIQANQIVANQMMEGLDELAYAFDNELQAKEEEINEVKAMMSSLTKEIQEIELNLAKNTDIQQLKAAKEQEYEICKLNLKKLLERAQSKDLATLVQISEQELANHDDEVHDDDEGNDPDGNLTSLITLTLFQYRRRRLVEKMLATIASDQNYQIDKYKHLMKLCLKGSLDDNGSMGNVLASGDTDDDEAGAGANGNGNLDEAEKIKDRKLRFEDEDIDEDALLDILINNLDPY